MKRLTSGVAAAALIASLSGGAFAETVRVAYDADPVSLDPYEQLSGGTLQLSHMVFDPLVRWNQDLGFDARLAAQPEAAGGHALDFFLEHGPPDRALVLAEANAALRPNAEAMAQLAGVLLLRKLENTGKLAVLWSIDKVKLRGSVVPGDQLRIEVETLRMKGETAQVRGTGTVAGRAVCEATLMFTMLEP